MYDQHGFYEGRIDSNGRMYDEHGKYKVKIEKQWIWEREIKIVGGQRWFDNYQKQDLLDLTPGKYDICILIGVLNGLNMARYAKAEATE